jgi:hypothetical protein
MKTIERKTHLDENKTSLKSATFELQRKKNAGHARVSDHYLLRY